MDNVVSFTPNDILVLCNFILAIAAVGTLFFSFYKKAKEPNERQDQEILDIKKTLEEHDKRFNDISNMLKHDKERLDELESAVRVTNRVIIKTLQVLVRHGISGNNQEELKKADDLLNKYLLGEIGEEHNED